MTKKQTQTKTIALFAIGPTYGERTGLLMGELYEVGDTSHRLGWSLLADYVARGYTIAIRPATAAELAWAEVEAAKHEAFVQRLNDRAATVFAEYDTLLTGT